MGFLQMIFPNRYSDFRNKITEAQNQLSKHPDAVFGDTETCPLEHYFTDGIYVRKITIPAGAVIVGKIHKHDHPNFLVSGTVIITTEFDTPMVLQGPQFIISKAGTKRALRAVTDLEWITIHSNPSNTQDLKKLEQKIIAPNYEALDRYLLKNKIISSIKRFIIRR